MRRGSTVAIHKTQPPKECQPTLTPLSEEKKDLALSGAMKKAEELLKRSLIFGAYIVVDGKVKMTDFVRQHLIKKS